MSDSSSQDEDFDGFNDTVGQVTITPEERYLISRAVVRDCNQNLMWSPLIRMAYYSITEKQLKKMKEADPKFIATAISIDLKNKKALIT